MFNQNDLSDARQRLKDMASHADQARLTNHRSAGDENSPLWVRFLSAVLDRSRWTLVRKSELSHRLSANASIRLASSPSAAVECEAR